MLTTIEEATLFVQGKLAKASPRRVHQQFQGQFIGIGQVTWVGVSYDTIASFPRQSICLKRGYGVKGDKRSGASPTLAAMDLFRFLLPRVTSVNFCQVILVSQEDDTFLEQHDALIPGEKIKPGSRGENIRVCGLDLVRLPFGSTLFFINPAGELSAASLFVTGGRGNALTLMVRSSSRRGDEIETGWFVAAFMDDV